MELMVVKAIRRLQDVRGSTAREINDFLSKEFGVPVSGIKKSVKVALKRALNYGILKNKKYGTNLSSDFKHENFILSLFPSLTVAITFIIPS